MCQDRSGSPYSTLAWLRLPPGAPTARAILAHVERLRAIRELRISPEVSRRVHQNPLLQLAREAAQTAVYHFKEYEPDRRYGTLVALMIENAATVTDEILDLNDRLIGSFFTKVKNKYERAFAEQGKAINDKVRLYANVGAALVSAREQWRDPYIALLQEALDRTDELARVGQLPDVELSSAGLKISPIENSVPKEADALKQTLYGILP